MEAVGFNWTETSDRRNFIFVIWSIQSEYYNINFKFSRDVSVQPYYSTEFYGSDAIAKCHLLRTAPLSSLDKFLNRIPVYIYTNNILMFESQVITDWTSYSSFIFFTDQAIVNNSFVDWWVLVQFTDCCKTLFTVITFEV